MSTPEQHPIPVDQALSELAAWLRAVGDPIRIHTLRLLARDAFGVQELCHLLDSKQPSLSHHLKILLQAGLVTTRRERTTVFYRRDPSGALAGTLKHRLLAEIDAQPLPSDIELRLQEIHQLRSEASRRFLPNRLMYSKHSKNKLLSFKNTAP